jgi:hypothetical protein
MRDHDDTLSAVHDLTRRSFIEANAELIAPHIGDRELVVSDGRVREETITQWRERFGGALASATFERWEDVEPPRSGVSADGTMAWLVEVVAMSGTRGAAPFESRTARLTVFEKRDGRWRRVVNASTTADQR